MRSTSTTLGFVARRPATAAAIIFTEVNASAWMILPAQKWALVTLGVSATLLQVALFIVSFPVSRRAATLIAVATFIWHGMAISFTRHDAPTLILGDQPGPMPSSIII